MHQREKHIIMEKSLSVGVIVSTYNNPEWLRKLLWGYACQTHKKFELIIADDGSGPETSALIKDFRESSLPDIKHVWHPDEGFRKCKILNKALATATSDYLIFTDQDCIPRQDFIETHLRYARQGYILSGGYYKLPMPISKQLTEEDVLSQRAFRLEWLRKQGLKCTFKNTKLIQSPPFAAFMNFITPTKATWNGMNSSGWKKDMLAVNGFNESMQYGGMDREFGERLFNMGIRSMQIRYSAICLHLEHKRPYKNEAAMAANREIRKEVRRKKIVKTPNGIEKSRPE